MGATSPFDDDPLTRPNITPEGVTNQADKICRSGVFAAKVKEQEFLRYVASESIKGIAPTALDVAKAVWRKGLDRGDSHVRGLAGKVRAGLKRYYATEGVSDGIVLDLPPRSYSLVWKHSPHTLVGKTSPYGWILRAAKLSPDDAERAVQTSRKFWPHLALIFPVYCDEPFKSNLVEGKIHLPEQVKLFFNSIGSQQVFVTTSDRIQIRIYPLNVWLEEWARSKSSENALDHNRVRTYERWGKGCEINQKGEIDIHSKLLATLNLPVDRESFEVSLCFDPEGFVYFMAPAPAPRIPGKFKLFSLSSKPKDLPQGFYCVLLVGVEKEDDFEQAMQGSVPFNLKSYGYIVASGEGDPPVGIEERIRAKYGAVLLPIELPKPPAPPIIPMPPATPAAPASALVQPPAEPVPSPSPPPSAVEPS